MNGAAPPPAWLVARPIAHRGLHDVSNGIVENTMGAAKAAIDRGLTIECDVQLSRDGEAMVIHDDTLERLTGASGPVNARTAAALRSIAYTVGSDHIASLPDLLDLIDGRVPLVCEIKSRFDGDMRLGDRVADLVRTYAGPMAIKSFDPDVIIRLRAAAPCPLGIVAEADYRDPEWSHLSAARKRVLAELLHFGRSRPDFLSYRVDDLPHAVPYLCRAGMGIPVMAWTVRHPAQRDLAEAWADQMVFEGFLP